MRVVEAIFKICNKHQSLGTNRVCVAWCGRRVLRAPCCATWSLQLLGRGGGWVLGGPEKVGGVLEAWSNIYLPVSKEVFGYFNNRCNQL